MKTPGLRPRTSLRVKLISWSLIPTVIILVAVAAVILYALQRVAEGLVIERDREVTRLMARQVQTELASYEATISDLAARLSLEPDLGAQCAELHRAVSRMAAFDGGLVLLDAQGRVVTTAPMQERLLRRDRSDRDYFRRAYLLPRPAYASVSQDGPDGAQAVGIARAITRPDGSFGGVVLGVFALRNGTLGGVYGQAETSMVTRLQQDPLYWQRPSAAPAERDAAGLNALLQRAGFVRYSASSTASAFLVDRQGVVIQGTNVAQVGQVVPSEDTLSLVRARHVGAVRTRDQAGNEIVACYAPIGDTGWGLVTHEDWDALYGPARRLSRFLIALLAAGVVAPAAVVTLAVRRITHPVDELIAAARDVGAGRFRRVSLATGDELTDLAEQFNLMSAQLEASYHHLEQRIADRTNDLEALLGVSREVSRTLSPQRVLTAGLQALLSLVGAHQGAACISFPEGEPLTVHAGPDSLPEVLLRELCLTVAERQQPSVMLDPRQPEAPMLLLVPLRSPETALGALVARTPDAEISLRKQGGLIISIGQQTSVALGNALLFERASQVAVMAERQRLARDLHDSVSQALYGVSLYARAADRLLASGQTEAAQQRLADLQLSARQALAEMRLLIYQLRPAALDELGLAKTLRLRLESVESRAGLEIELDVHASDALRPELEEALFFIAQEALNNVVRHAHATRVRASLATVGDQVRLEIRDNGQGFDLHSPRAGGIGLSNMRARASELGGTVRLISSPSEGTIVQVEAPL
jgi:signal transduction histidine kinase